MRLPRIADPSIARTSKSLKIVVQSNREPTNLDSFPPVHGLLHAGEDGIDHELRTLQDQLPVLSQPLIQIVLGHAGCVLTARSCDGSSAWAERNATMMVLATQAA
jgi:hypothetical protein